MPAVGSQGIMVSMKAKAILESTLYCKDLEAARDFYSEVLGLEIIGAEKGRHVFFRCGSGVLLLFNPERTLQVWLSADSRVIPSHGAEGPGHLAFAATAAELGRWKRHLESSGVAIETEVTWPQGGRSIYFRDPAGNSLEIATPELWRAKP
jgi:catechol 2,3-dioxygenase-like lactoylglutathione lyase family enzyme